MTGSSPRLSSHEAAPDLSGRALGDYRVLRRLGRGAMADVYLAEQGSLRRQVALKVLRHDLARDASYVERFHHEAMAAAALVHANIVQIHEVGQVDGVHFIAQEYVPGHNLGELIRRGGPPDVKLAVAILRQVAAALHKAAGQGVVHRDIKPENILLARTGEVKVADFGLARVISSEANHLTQIGVTMGTPLYMSPEQAEGKPLDARSDIYSLGVTTYHMLAGQPPFTGETPLAVAMQHLNNRPRRLEELRPDLPEGLCRIVHQMIAKKPDERYASARELLHDLRALSIEGLEDGWSDEAHEWTTAEMLAASDARVEATQRLAAVMQTSALVSQKRRPHLWIIVLLIAFLAGVAVAYWRRPDPLLADAATNPVPKRSSAWTQLFHAKEAGTEEAWQAVQKHYSENEYAVRLAQQGLVRHYLFDSGEYEKALPLAEDLAGLGETDKSFRALGLAGQCIALAALGEHQQSRQFFDQLTQDLLDTLDDQTLRTLDAALSSSRTALSAEAQQKLQRMRSSLPEEDEI